MATASNNHTQANTYLLLGGHLFKYHSMDQQSYTEPGRRSGEAFTSRTIAITRPGEYKVQCPKLVDLRDVVRFDPDVVRCDHDTVNNLQGTV
jgi:hypothetical protein